MAMVILCSPCLAVLAIFGVALASIAASNVLCDGGALAGFIAFFGTAFVTAVCIGRALAGLTTATLPVDGAVDVAVDGVVATFVGVAGASVAGVAGAAASFGDLFCLLGALVGTKL